MAKFRLMTTHIVNHQRLKALTTVADSPANARDIDVVWAGLNAAALTPTMIPLDQSAVTMQQQAISMYGLKPVNRGSVCGVDSIG